MRTRTLSLLVPLLILLPAATPVAGAEEEDTHGRDAWVPADEVGNVYQEHCAVCHGENLEGAAQGPALVGAPLAGGDRVLDLVHSIAAGNPAKGMPGWQGTLPDARIRSFAIYILEKRARPASENDYGLGELPEIPSDTLPTEKHDLRVETLAEEILYPYAIAPLPGGDVLLTERTRGLRVVSPDGKVSEPIEGTPRVYTDGVIQGYTYTGLGWMLDVAIHPDYAENGWIYLSYGDRCSACNAASRESGEPVSMAALVRGRIRNGKWVDEELIWKADTRAYSEGTELGVGARITFDDAGYVYLSIGAKGEYPRAQDLSWPDGKIHRVHDDGRIPEDNPYVDEDGALPSIWSLGHRNPQGLEFDAHTGLLWESEHGPRGGDEANVILPGRNYGWPRVSLGMDYDGSPIGGGKPHGIDPAILEGPRVDWTPSIGVSSIAFYEGEAFPDWSHDLLVGSLSRNEVERLVVENGSAVHREVLVRDIGRVRDLAVGSDGFVYLLLEHSQGSRLVRLVPSEAG